MKALEQALHDHELIVLRVIGEWWELNLTGSQKRECIQQLAKTLNDLDMKREIDYLGPEESAALMELVRVVGRCLWRHLNANTAPLDVWVRERWNAMNLGLTP